MVLICGRLTMESSFTGGWYPDLTAFQGQKMEREDYIATYDAEFHAVAFDVHGKLGWKDSVIHDEDPGYDKAHIVEVLSEDVEDICKSGCGRRAESGAGTDTWGESG